MNPYCKFTILLALPKLIHHLQKLFVTVHSLEKIMLVGFQLLDMKHFRIADFLQKRKEIDRP